MKKDIFFYSVSEIREYILNLCEHGKAGDAFNIVLSSFALIFFALLPSFIAKENTKELHPMADYITEENIEKLLNLLKRIREQQ